MQKHKQTGQNDRMLIFGLSHEEMQKNISLDDQKKKACDHGRIISYLMHKIGCGSHR